MYKRQGMPMVNAPKWTKHKMDANGTPKIDPFMVPVKTNEAGSNMTGQQRSNTADHTMEMRCLRNAKRCIVA